MIKIGPCEVPDTCESCGKFYPPKEIDTIRITEDVDGTLDETDDLGFTLCKTCCAILKSLL